MAVLTPAAFRARFPLLARRTYVNSCSQGALSTDVDAAMRRFLDSWNDEGSPWETWVGEVERLRTTFASLIGADADEIAVLPSASTGINAIASALTFDGTRRRVVMGRFEFPTMAQVWLAQRERGAEIGWADPVDGMLPPESYGKVVDERTLVVPATHVCFRNGHKTDIAGVAALCHDRGAYCFLDDYQRTGTEPMDVRALGVDFMVTGALKYLLGPSGVAFLYVRRELIERLVPTMTGWFGRVNPFAFSIDDLDWSSSARRFESGTPMIPNVYGAQAGLDLLGAVGLDAVEQTVAELTVGLMAWAGEAGVVTATPTDPARRGALVVLRSTDAPALVTRLGARGVIASCRDDGLRISFHGYNTQSDLDAVIAALEAESAMLVKEKLGELHA
ncbi:MAG: aminotransferase class V-fold PLP-dependent enzyme [Vicinamibacterales bacterium]|nr:aminotransferase class V-fold PLP-dependent enzyme [Vicinamibacterales bacterium]